MQDTFYIETNDGYEKLKGIKNIEWEIGEGIEIILTTKFNSQSDFILRGCFFSNLETRENNYFKFNNDIVGEKYFSAKVDKFTEGEYDNTFNLNIIY